MLHLHRDSNHRPQRLPISDLDHLTKRLVQNWKFLNYLNSNKFKLDLLENHVTSNLVNLISTLNSYTRINKRIIQCKLAELTQFGSG